MTRFGTIALVTCSLVCLSSHALTFATNDATIKQSPGHGHLAWNGEVGEYLYIPADGLYEITIRAAGMAMGGGWPEMCLRVNFVSEARVNVSQTGFKDYVFTQYLTAGTHVVGASFTNDASNGSEDRNLLLETITVAPVEGGGEPTLGSEANWEIGAQQREQEVLAGTDAAIAENRMSAAWVVVVDQHGNPVDEAQVEVTQTEHEFLFGCNAFTQGVFSMQQENDAYNDQFSALFNYATLPFYWNALEETDGSPNYERLDGIVAWCEANDIAMKGHAVLYGDPAFIPAWSNGVPSIQRQLDHVSEVFARYNGSIDFWDLVNEPFNAPGMDFDAAHFHARSLAPNDTFVVNSYGQFYNFYDAMFQDGHPEFFQYMKEAELTGIPFDAIGIQSHAPLDTAFRLDLVQAHLDHYASLGKEIHLTEFSPTTNGSAVLGAPWRGTWTEATQAQFAEDFYRVAFAHPAVTAITWWDFADIGAWLEGGGLLNADLTPKPAYNTLLNLIRGEWMTDVAGTPDQAGEFSFDGFHGAYDVTVTYGDETVARTMDVTKDGENTLVVTVTTEEEDPVDTTAPVITMLGSPMVTQEVFDAYADAGATATDNMDGNLTSAIVVNNTVDTGVTGLYTVNYDVTDSAGNAASRVSRMVWIADSTAPVVTLNGAATMNVEAGSVFADPGATASDNYDISVSVNVTGAVDTNSLGQQVLQYGATDSAGNPAVSVARVVTVADTKAPTLSLNGASTMAVAVNGTFNDPGASATDSFEGSLSGAIEVSGNVNTAVVGTYTLTYAVSDSSGNGAATVARTVVVEDTVAPVISRSGAAIVSIEVGSAYNDAGATATDNYDGNVSVQASGVVDSGALGTYTVTYTAQDSSGNAATSVTRTVHVVDTTAPVVSLVGEAAVSLTEGDAFNDPGVEVSDNYDASVSVSVVGTVDTTTPGEYTLTYVATDASGNSSEVSRTVTVEAKAIEELPEPEGTLIGIIGDVDNNGVITSWDVNLIGYLNLYGATTLNNYLDSLNRNPAVMDLADVDQNGVVNGWDMQVLNYVRTHGLEATNAALAANGKPLAQVGEELWINNQMANL